MNARTSLVPLVLLQAALLAAASFRIEPESLAGGWKACSQKDASGGKIALGTVAGATASGAFIVDEPGEYTVWVRNISFGGNFRRASIDIDSKTISQGTGDGGEVRFGTATWEKIKNPVILEKGRHTITLRSLSRHCRFDSIIFATDCDFIPSGRGESIDEAVVSTEGFESPLIEPPNNQFGDRVLVFCGGRPWVAGETKSALDKAGFAVSMVDSRLLGGLGGSIKTFPSDKVEPTPLDALDEAMASLPTQKAVIVTSIDADKQIKFFSPERTKQLRSYVENGGALVVNFRAPSEALNDILPVEPIDLSFNDTKPSSWKIKVTTANRRFSPLPREWNAMRVPMPVRPATDAKVLIEAVNGETTVPFLAVRKVGKGRVYFLNEDWERRYDSGCQLFTWAYGTTLMGCIAAEAVQSHQIFEASALLFPSPRTVERRTIQGKVKLTLANPDLTGGIVSGITEESAINGQDETGQREVGRRFKFTNGVVLETHCDGAAIEITFPGENQPVVRKMNAPVIELKRAIGDGIDSDTYEFTKAETSGRVFANIHWKIVRTTTRDDGRATLFLEDANGNKAEWSFVPGEFNIGDRFYRGISDEFKLTDSKLRVGAFETRSQIRIGNSLAGHKVRRFSCYQPPRGYAEYDFGRDSGDTYEWGWFGSGQPFSYVAAPNGVFVEFPDKPMSASCRQTRKQDDAAIAEAICINVGAQPAPCSTKGVWHVFSPGPEQGNNTYIAWPQFVRKHIVSKIGTKQHSPLPTATHLNSSSEEEQLSTIEAAGKSGFMRYAMPICPSAIESIPTWGKFYDAIGKSGMTTWPWTAGDYTHGSSEKLFGHNDWFIHVPKGSAAHRIAEIKPGNPIEDNGFEIYQYGGHYPVVDLTNPDFQKWYAKILDEACANGLTGIYLDMYGKASGNVNYLKFPASPGIEGMLNIAREFDRHGMPVGVEGENPMFLDTFWFRERLYAPHAGKEFALVGMQPRTDEKGDGFALDFFRMAMYNCYMYTQIDGYIQGFERFPGESRMVERILRLVPTCSMLARKIGIPQVRETPFGTSWISQTGAALFFWHNVEELELALPRGYVLKTMTKPDGSVMELSGKVLKNVSGDSIVYIEKKQD